ncbi:MAG: SGNH/GDSL hydrolase family protein [Bacteroidota bacterium]
MQVNSQKRIYTYLALGDSYTIGESIDVRRSWPVQLVNHVNKANYGFQIGDPKIIAKTGWTTQELKTAITEEMPSKNYDFVSLLIGVNNQYRGYPFEEYSKEFRSLLDIAVAHAGGNSDKVIVLSIPDYGFTPHGKPRREAITMDIDRYNVVNRKISDEYGIKYYDITQISRDGLKHTDLVAKDKLHPSSKQYTLWVDKILRDEGFLRLFDN